VTFSEHHLDYPGYFPNPLLAATLVLAATSTVWSGAMPTLLTLRPPAIIAEDLAWMWASYPGRVVVAFASGNQAQEQELSPTPEPDLVKKFEGGLATVAGALGNLIRSNQLEGDIAIREARGRIPVLSAARSRTATRRAVRMGMGLLFSPTLSAKKVRQCLDEYRAAGGSGPTVLIRRVWINEGGAPVESGLAEGVKPPDDSWCSSGTSQAVSDELLSLLKETGADAYNLRVHVPGLVQPAVDEQIARVGADVLPVLKRSLSSPRG
jgi:alkanesulfonate monooxygenase SsuD/methylene tetrahydromethanopterin reductase-like flavin-dependent oxidoreductase (luciferase family)